MRTDLYYFCRIGKKPNIIKIKQCCFKKNCPHLKSRPRKKPYTRGDELNPFYRIEDFNPNK